MLINKNDNVIYMTMTSKEYDRIITSMENAINMLETYYRENTKELKELYQQTQVLKGRE